MRRIKIIFSGMLLAPYREVVSFLEDSLWTGDQPDHGLNTTWSTRWEEDRSRKLCYRYDKYAFGDDPAECFDLISLIEVDPDDIDPEKHTFVTIVSGWSKLDPLWQWAQQKLCTKFKLLEDETEEAWEKNYDFLAAIPFE